MRTWMLALALGAVGWGLAGCASHDTPEAVSTYQCPECKNTVEWRPLRSDKPWIGRNVIVHSCPNCRQEWGSNLSGTTSCKLCNERHLECPLCRKHEG